MHPQLLNYDLFNRRENLRFYCIPKEELVPPIAGGALVRRKGGSEDTRFNWLVNHTNVFTIKFSAGRRSTGVNRRYYHIETNF